MRIFKKRKKGTLYMMTSVSGRPMTAEGRGGDQDERMEAEGV